jgi:hypothetical protein
VNLLLRIVGLLGAILPGDLRLCLDQVYGESTPSSMCLLREFWTTYRTSELQNRIYAP